MTDSRASKTSLRTYEPGDEKAIISVLESVFGQWPGFDLDCSQAEHWRWRYLRKEGNERHIYLLLHGNRIVGCQHYTPVDFKVGDSVVPAMLAGDIAICEAFRGERAVARLAAAERELRKTTGEQFSYFETRNPNLIRRYKRVGYELPIHSRHLVKVFRASEHFAHRRAPVRWLAALGFRLLQVPGRLRVAARAPAAEDSPVIEPAVSFDSRFDRLWEKLAGHYGFIVRRDSDYLDWRYGDRRGGRFRVLCTIEGDDITGFVALRVNRKRTEYPVGHVVDLLCLPGRDDLARALVAAALDHFRNRGTNIIHCLVPGRHPYYAIYRQNGFVDTRERTAVWLRGTGITDGQLETIRRLPPDRIYYSYGDIDSI